MIKAYVEYWKNYFDFKGTTNRPGFWWCILAELIISVVLGLLCAIIGNSTVTTIVTTIWGLANLIPGLAIIIRRLRDGGKSWANIFWALLPIVGEIILIVKLCAPTKGASK